VSRDVIMNALARQQIGTSVHFIPVHQLSAYRRILHPDECRSVPVTDRVAEEVVSLPMYPGLTDPELARVTGAVATITGCTVAA
jgi:dTDP-4-amino-4,6-dideoxygalactose transaminase